MAEHHDTYINSVVDNIRRNRLEIRAPVMDKGDVLFWNSRTIHGSLDSQDASHSRSSITCHAIPKSRRFLQLQTRAVDIKTDSLNGAEIFRPKDLRSLKNRLVLGIESTFPTPFYWAKRKAMVRLVSSKQATR
jgi:phytanoyl-CoA hydroxylase